MTKQIKYLDLGNSGAEDIEERVNSALCELQEAGHRVDHIYIRAVTEPGYLTQTRVQITYRAGSKTA